MIVKAFVILVLAAALEVGGDALVRIGLGGRSYLIAAGAITTTSKRDEGMISRPLEFP